MSKFTVKIGKDGLGASWQQRWDPTTPCVKCATPSRIAIVVFEDRETDNPQETGEQFICDLYSNKGEGAYWFHDCAAFAIYLCPECFTTTCLNNQA